MELLTRIAENIADRRVSHWDTLDQISKTALTKASYISTAAIPLIASLVGIIVRTNESFGPTLNASLSNASLPLAAVAAYFAALLFCTGVILTALLCPRDVRQYERFQDYQDFLLKSGTEIVLFSRGVRALRGAENTPTISKDSLEDYTRFMRKHIQSAAQANLVEGSVSTLSDAGRYWAELVEEKPNWRVAISALFFASISTSALLFFVYAPYLVFKAL